MIQTLIDIGLTLNQSKIYLGYLHHGEMTAAELSRKLNLDKSSVYKSSEELTEKGILIKTVKSRDTKYLAKSPDVLLEIFEQKKFDILSKESQIGLLVNQLKESAKHNNRETFIRVEKGVDAHIAAMEDSLKDNVDKIILEKWEMDNPIFNSKEYDIYVHKYAKRRVLSGIKDLFLADENVLKISSRYDSLMKTSVNLNKEVRIFPTDAKDNNSYRVYKDTIEIVSFDENNDFIVVTIKDKYISSLMKTVFYFIWNRSSKV